MEIAVIRNRIYFFVRSFCEVNFIIFALVLSCDENSMKSYNKRNNDKQNDNIIEIINTI